MVEWQASRLGERLESGGVLLPHKSHPVMKWLLLLQTGCGWEDPIRNSKAKHKHKGRSRSVCRKCAVSCDRAFIPLIGGGRRSQPMQSILRRARSPCLRGGFWVEAGDRSSSFCYAEFHPWGQLPGSVMSSLCP